MNQPDADPNPAAAALGDGCCVPASSCVFAKALLARAATCELVERRARGEGEALECTRPVARHNCETLLALLRERSRFALQLPRPGAPLMHAKALRLQCGALAALQRSLGEPAADVHRLVGAAQQRHGSLAELPFDGLVRAIVEWPAPRQRRAEPR